MKFSKLSQLFLVSVFGLLGAVLLSGCMIVTIDYVFVADSTGNSAGSAGQIQVYAVDSQSGAIRTGATTVASGGTGPVALAMTSDYGNLYVANATSKNVVHFTVSSEGVLTAKDTLSLSDTPVALAVNPKDNYLYVLSGTTSATLSAYALSSGTMTTTPVAQKTLTLANYGGDTIVPTALIASVKGSYVYAAAYDQSAYNPNGSVSSDAHSGWIYGFSVSSSGDLTPMASSPYQAGVKPSALATDPTNRFVYATDYAANHLLGYTIGTTGALSYLLNGPFKTGNEPSSVVVDPQGKFIYLTNSLDNSVSAYAITLSSGSPTTIVNSTTSIYTTDTQPMALAIDPALGRFIYTANRLGNSVSGFRLNPDDGVLTTTQATPYPTTGSQPTALVIVPHGNHATQAVTVYNN